MGDLRRLAGRFMDDGGFKVEELVSGPAASFRGPRATSLLGLPRRDGFAYASRS